MLPKMLTRNQHRSQTLDMIIFFFLSDTNFSTDHSGLCRVVVRLLLFQAASYILPKYPQGLRSYLIKVWSLRCTFQKFYHL